MELRHLRYFVALAEYLSFTKAADRVHVTQSTLSHQIRQLEEEGLMQVFFVAAGRREPIVGVVGALQFDVITSRLRTECR